MQINIFHALIVQNKQPRHDNKGEKIVNKFTIERYYYILNSQLEVLLCSNYCGQILIKVSKIFVSQEFRSSRLTL